MVVLIISIMLLDSISIPNKWFADKNPSLILHSKNKSILMNEGQVRQVHKTMRLQTLLCLCYYKPFQMWCSQTSQCHNNVWKQNAAFSAITVASIEIQMLLNLLLKHDIVHQHDGFA